MNLLGLVLRWKRNVQKSTHPQPTTTLKKMMMMSEDALYSLPLPEVNSTFSGPNALRSFATLHMI